MVDILLLKGMVIAVGQRLDLLRMWFHVIIDLLGRCDTCQQQHVIVFEVFETTHGDRSLGSLSHSLQPVIVERREEELLIGIEVHLFDQNPELHRSQVLRTLRDDDDVCPILPLHRFT